MTLTPQQHSLVAGAMGVGMGVFLAGFLHFYLLPILILCILLALFIGFRSLKVSAVWSGASFGFFMVLSFLINGYYGTYDQIPGFALMALLFIVIGTAVSTMAAMIGNKIRIRFFLT